MKRKADPLPVPVTGWTKFIAWRWTIMLSFFSAARGIVKFSRKIREFKIRRPPQPTSDDLGMFWEATLDSNVHKFRDAIAHLKRKGQDYFEAATIQRYTNEDFTLNDALDKNVLELLLGKNPPRDAELFYDSLVDELTESGFYQLIENSIISAYCTENPALILRIRNDCEFVILAVNLFCTIRDSQGKTILHKAAETNKKLFRDLIKSFQHTAGCHITVEWFLIITLLNLVPNLLFGVEGVCHVTALAIQGFIYIFWNQFFPVLVCWFLHECDNRGDSVLEYAARNGCSDVIISFIEEYEKTNCKAIMQTYEHTTIREIRVTLSHVHGLVLGFLILMAAHLLVREIFPDGVIFRNSRNITIMLGLHALYQRKLIYRSGTMLGYIIRFGTHLFHMPYRGMISTVLLVGFDIGIICIIIYIVRYPTRWLLKKLLCTMNKQKRTFLADCHPQDILIWLKWENPFVMEQLKKALTADLYRYWASRQDITDDDLFRILEQFKKLASSGERLQKFIIAHPQRTAVISLAVHRGRPHAPEEVSHIKHMAEDRGFTHLESVDIEHAQEFKEGLKSKLTMAKELDPEMILIFIMAHGNIGRLFGADSSSLSIQNLVDVINSNKDLDDIPKFLFIQACQGREEAMASSPDVEVGETGINSNVASFGVQSIANCQSSQAALVSPADAEKSGAGIGSTFSGFEVQSSSNILLFMATQPNTIAFRNTFIDFICQELSTHEGHEIKLEDVLHQVKQSMHHLFKQCPQIYPNMMRQTYIMIKNRLL